MSREGGCACGAVRYRLGREPMFVHCCHCTSCQTETGSAFAINALIEADQVETLKGAPEPVMTPSESGRGQQVWRCPECKVAAVEQLRRGHRHPALRPRRHARRPRRGRAGHPYLHALEAAVGAGCPKARLAVEAYYDSSRVWPAESLERRKALFG